MRVVLITGSGSAAAAEAAGSDRRDTLYTESRSLTIRQTNQNRIAIIQSTRRDKSV